MYEPLPQPQYQTYGDYIFDNMLKLKGLPPGIYKIVKDPTTQGRHSRWYPVKELDKFKLPPKLYGKVNEYGNYIWQRFKNSNNHSINVLITGIKGTGKTETAKLICNLAINDGYPVYMVEGANADENLLRFLDSLDNCIIFIDEFAKIFKGQLQNQMLTMLTNITNKHKMWLLTDNEKYTINQFLLNRPGRIRYHLEYGKLKRYVVEEYCRDKGVKESFFKDLIERYENAYMFTFDQLQALVEEHLHAPQYSLDELLELLNIEGLNADRSIHIHKITNKKDDALYKPGMNLYTISDLIPNDVLTIYKKKTTKGHEGGWCYEAIYKIPILKIVHDYKQLGAEEIEYDVNKYKVIFKKEDLVIYYEITSKMINIEEIDPVLICDKSNPKILGANTNIPPQPPMQPSIL